MVFIHFATEPLLYIVYWAMNGRVPCIYGAWAVQEVLYSMSACPIMSLTFPYVSIQTHSLECHQQVNEMQCMKLVFRLKYAKSVCNGARCRPLLEYRISRKIHVSMPKLMQQLIMNEYSAPFYRCYMLLQQYCTHSTLYQTTIHQAILFIIMGRVCKK